MATVHIGTFGVERDPSDFVFTYFGETIRVAPDASDLGFAEFLEVAKDIDVESVDSLEEVAEAAEALSALLRQQIHPDDWDLFWSTAKANRQFLKDVMAVSRGIVEAITDLPIGESSDGSGGQSTTAVKSSGGSLSPEQERKRRRIMKRARGGGKTRQQIREAAEDRALTVLSGRPDLQTAVLQAREARQATG
jgi:hypothetical protein